MMPGGLRPGPQRLPRVAGLVIVTLGATAIHVVVPFGLSRLGSRGQTRRRAGLLAVTLGAALIGSALAAHGEAAPQGWPREMRSTPEYLLRRGPYRFTRNPMYVGELVVWLGWALFYASPAVWTGLGVLCAGLATIVPREERRLLERFGDDYRAYLAEVPRF